MTRAIRPVTTLSRTLSTVASVILCLAFSAPAARAACVSAGAHGPFGAPPVQFGHHDDGPSLGTGAHSIVGMWYTEFLLGDGPDLYDQGFEQFHSDGTELMVDNAVPPSFGNVCVGVWEPDGPRTIKLRHVTWNWDDQGHKAGTFQLLVTLTVDQRGTAFKGTYVADSFDLSGALIPDLHAEGKVHARRITVR